MCLSAAACAQSPAPSPALPVAAAIEPPHEPAPEAAIANAGAERCRLGAPVDIGAATKKGTYALGFGAKGGLAVWVSPRSVLARPLSATASPAGDDMALPLPADAQPEEVVPAGRGFVVIARSPLRKRDTCAGRCPDPTCSRWPAGVPQPHVCTVPCTVPCDILVGIETVLLHTDRAGRAIGEPAALPTTGGPIEAVIQGEPRSFGFVTGRGLFMVRVRPDDGLEIARTELPKADFVLPVRGAGPASVLLLNKDGSAQIVDAGGAHPVTGNLHDSHSGQIVDARFQARWGPDGKIHVARQAWLIAKDAIRYATLVGGELRFDGPAERGFRAPFAEYVEPWHRAGLWERGSWLQRNIGEDIDLRAVDPEASAGAAFWTGVAFAFTYRVERSDGWLLRAIKADCSG